MKLAVTLLALSVFHSNVWGTTAFVQKSHKASSQPQSPTALESAATRSNTFANSLGLNGDGKTHLPLGSSPFRPSPRYRGGFDRMASQPIPSTALQSTATRSNTFVSSLGINGDDVTRAGSSSYRYRNGYDGVPRGYNGWYDRDHGDRSNGYYYGDRLSSNNGYYSSSDGYGYGSGYGSNYGSGYGVLDREYSGAPRYGYGGIHYEDDYSTGYGSDYRGMRYGRDPAKSKFKTGFGSNSAYYENGRENSSWHDGVGQTGSSYFRDSSSDSGGDGEFDYSGLRYGRRYRRGNYRNGYGSDRGYYDGYGNNYSGYGGEYYGNGRGDMWNDYGPSQQYGRRNWYE